MESLIRLDNVSKEIEKKIIVSHINIAINSSETVGIVGHNGSGKSTLLKILVGISAVTSGNRIIRPGIKIGFVPERFPKLRISPTDYLILMGRIQGISGITIRKKVAEMIERFNLSFVKDEPIENFSKGMLQKLAIMQSIISLPNVLVMDEPLSGLDINFQDEFINILIDLKAHHTSIVFSCHEEQLLERLADRVVVLRSGVIERQSHLSKETSYHNVRIEFRMSKPNFDSFNSNFAIKDMEINSEVGTLICSRELCDTNIKEIFKSGGSILSVKEFTK